VEKTVRKMEAASPTVSVTASASSTTAVMTSAAQSAGSTSNDSTGPVVVQDTSVRLLTFLLSSVA